MACCTGKKMNSGTGKTALTSPTVTAYLWAKNGSDGLRNSIKQSDFVDGVLPAQFIADLTILSTRLSAA